MCVINTSLILYWHLCRTSELKQVVMVASSSWCLTFFDTITYNHNLYVRPPLVCCWKGFFKAWWICNSTQRAFCAHFFLRQNDAVPDQRQTPLLVENSFGNSIILTLHEMSSMQIHQVFKNFNNKPAMCTSPSYGHTWPYLKKVCYISKNEQSLPIA